MAESTDDGCATDWHARAVLNVGVTWDYIVRLYGYFCVSTTVHSGTSGFRENGVGFCKGREYSHADSRAASERLFRRCKRVSVGTATVWG